MHTAQLYKRIAFVTQDNVVVNAYEFITSKQPNVPVNDLLVSYAHSYITTAGAVPADTGKATLILSYSKGKCTYKHVNGLVIGTSVLNELEDGDEVVVFKQRAQPSQQVEPNEYDSFVRQFV
jgi:hypothetical protein